MRRQGGEETEEPKKGVWWQLVEVSGRCLDTHTQHIYIRTLLILHNEKVHFRGQVDVMTLQERNQEVVFRHTLTAGRSVWFLCCNIPAVTANHTTPSYTGENMRWCPIVYYYTQIPTMHHLIHFDMQCEMSIHANTNKSERIQRHVRSSAIIKTRNLNCNLCDNQSTDWSAVFNLRVETHKGLVRWIQGVTWRPPGLGHYYGLNMKDT